MQIDRAQFGEFLLELAGKSLWDLVDGLKDGRVITILSNAFAPAALRMLCENDISGAPVVDEQGKLCGMISMMNLVSFAMDLFNETFQPNRLSEEYLAKKGRFRLCTVAEIMDKYASTALDIHENSSLFQALEVMALSGQQRLAVVDSEKRVTGLISASIACKWMLTNIHRLPNFLRIAKSSEIKPFCFVYVVPVAQKACDAFRVLKKHKVNGCAIVDAKGHLCEALSSRDLRGINPESLTFRFLFNAIDVFKQHARELRPGTSDPVKPITISANTTFEEILRLLITNNEHQVFLVLDPQRASSPPVDMISQLDLLQFVVDMIKSPLARYT